MKLAVASLIVVSSTLLAGCAVYPDGTPAYSNGYAAYPAAPPPVGYYDPSYGYGAPAPVVQPGIYIEGGGGGYYGGPGPRGWNDGHGYQHSHDGHDGGPHGGDRGHNGGHGGPQAQQPPQPHAGGNPQQPHGPAGNPGRPPAQSQAQSRDATPNVGRATWGQPSNSPQGSEHNH
jgi:hypothetical protein